MCILSLAEDIGLNPKRTSSTNGGEYKSACPNCKDGKDRFCIWPNQDAMGRYWCRRCDCKGDAIQFCMDFMGLSYLDACKKLKTAPRAKTTIKGLNPFKDTKYIPPQTAYQTETWQNRGTQFINYCHDQLLKTPKAMQYLFGRGFTEQTIKKHKLGYNPNTLFDKKISWSLPYELNSNGNEKAQWLPKGIVIPSFDCDQLAKIKVRRSEWYEEDDLPKYVEISGSYKGFPILGDKSKPPIILESELDSILVQQFASDLCCCIALGGVGKRPDARLNSFLKSCSIILLSLDFDEAGKKEYSFWMSQYPNIHPWPAKQGKSPGDSFQNFQIDLYNWVLESLS